MYKVAIIGCGSIGANKDDKIDSPITENILTHAHAVYQNPKLELQALVDSNKEQLQKAIKKWQPKSAFNTIEQLFDSPEKMDIIVVAVPTEYHLEVLNKIINCSEDKKPQLIICEKPFCNSYDEANKIWEENTQKEIPPILINYIRRFDPQHQEIKKWIDEERFGKALNCRVLYTRGLKRDGCHAIDLMNWFFGNCKTFSLNFFNSIIDRVVSDPTITIFAEYQKCPSVIFQPCDGRKYGIFEIDICFEQARLRLIDNGLYYELYPLTDENEWGHKSLSYKLTDVVRKETKLQYAMYYLYENAIGYLEGRQGLFCVPDDAIEVHKIIKG